MTRKLSGTQQAALAAVTALDGTDGHVTARDIAARTGQSADGAAYTLRSLVSRGLVAPGSNDGERYTGYRLTAPRHPQVMDPADDPEEFIRASIYWYLFPTRTEVLDHAVRADYRHLARTYGPVRATEQGYPDATQRQARMITSRDLPWTLLGRAPERVNPRWQVILDEVRDLFAPVLIEQGTLFETGERQ